MNCSHPRRACSWRRLASPIQVTISSNLRRVGARETVRNRERRVKKTRDERDLAVTSLRGIESDVQRGHSGPPQLTIHHRAHILRYARCACQGLGESRKIRSLVLAEAIDSKRVLYCLFHCSLTTPPTEEYKYRNPLDETSTLRER